MFESVLIANRGEIACRVARTARALGLRVIAVYSEADAGALHTLLADEAHCIGPAPARESYLRVEAIADVVKRSGAASVHPGYGFLSENAELAEACAAAGATFVGPSPEALRAMGSKIEAKRIMGEAGIPLVPGYHGAQDDSQLARAADEIGFPVLIKASAGGGGRGMRVVEGREDVAAALDAARRESKAAFGDDALLVEKYLARPRHVEVQVLADAHDRVLHLFERDCSLQRRHQKIFEEAPAPDLGDAMREEMAAAAVAAARAIDYRGAGTVEFIVEDDAFYFMEMNTRLQVEHPVTEFVTGLDLVEWQLRVAAGEPLPFAQDEIALVGHAVEARIYAENPAKGYLPSTGRLRRFRIPSEAEAIRLDTGVREGDEVSMHYDPLLAKLIAHGDDRDHALARLRRALEASEIVGVETNVSMLVSAISHPALAAAPVDTGFAERERASLVGDEPTQRRRALAQIALGIVLRRSGPSPWDCADAWRPNLPARESLRLRDKKREIVVGVEHRADGLRIEVDGENALLSGQLDREDWLRGEIHGRAFRARHLDFGDEVAVVEQGRVHRFGVAAARGAVERSTAGADSLRAPMPGQILRVNVEVGQRVERGAALVVVEAMKMEHAVTAPHAGTVEALGCAEGDRVDEGAELVILSR